jgi:hypothetical protein
MEKKLIFLAAILILVLLSGCIQPPPEKCGDGTCGPMEKEKGICPQDCPQIVTHTECQNQQCVSVSGAGTDECSANSDCIVQTHKACQNQQCITVDGAGTDECSQNSDCITTTTESHFGVHLGSLNYNSAVSHIRELGEHIYARNVVYGDAFGWKAVKGSKESIAQCGICCDSTKSACGCSVGDKYYCTPSSRDSLLNYPILIDFYNNNLNQLVNFEAGRYDDTPPKELTADYPHGHEDIYRDYVSFLVQNFGNKVKYWVVGNEVEALIFWVGTPEEYADMLVIASEEIRKNCADCKVGISFAHPNLSPKRPEQRELWYSAIGLVCSSFDFIDAHFYDARFIEEGQLDKWKQTCPGKEFISTETGVMDYIVTGGKPQAGGSLEKQAQDLAKYNTLLFAEGYNKIYMYLMDTDYGMGGIFLHNGLIDEITNTRKPAFYSYKTMIEKVDYFTSITKITEGQYKYAFSNKGPVYVLWCDSGSCTLDSSIPTTNIRITDYQGNQLTQITLTESPIFVEETE